MADPVTFTGQFVSSKTLIEGGVSVTIDVPGRLLRDCALVNLLALQRQMALVTVQDFERHAPPQVAIPMDIVPQNVVESEELEESQELKETARELIASQPDIAHVELDTVLFLDNWVSKPKAFARCYSFLNHPIALFTPKKFGITVFRATCDWFNRTQMSLLLWHKLKHIPERGGKLVDHDIKDWLTHMRIDPEWARPGYQVPGFAGIEDRDG
jgi:hypothetical protein